jgi:hypothetical protein
MLACENRSKYLRVRVTGHYSNRPELLEQLRKVAVILSGDRGDGAAGDGWEARDGFPGALSRLRDRFSLRDFHAMIELYGSGATVQQVAKRFGVSESSIKRLLPSEHGRPRSGVQRWGSNSRGRAKERGSRCMP